MMERIVAMIVSFSKPKRNVFDNSKGMTTKIRVIAKVV